jgi:hypothetical protein
MAAEWSHEWLVGRICEACPERASQIRTLVASNNIQFVAHTGGDYLFFAADVRNRVIEFNVQPIARLWARAYAYQLLYGAISAARAPQFVQPILTDQAKAVALLRWALDEDLAAMTSRRTHVARRVKPYPEMAPLPFEDQTDAVSTLAGDLTMMSLGVILLHELAHIYLKHPPAIGPNAKNEEFDADLWSIHRVFDDIGNYCDQNYPERKDAVQLVTQKRSLGIALVWWWLASLECERGVRKSPSHPPSYQRLYNGLCEIADDPNELVWAMTYVVLGLHLCLGGHSWPHQAFDSFKEAVEYWCCRIGRLQYVST